MGVLRLGHTVRGLPAGDAPRGRVRASGRCRRGAPAHRDRSGRGSALPLGRRGRSEVAALPHRSSRTAGRGGQPQPLPRPGLPARVHHQPRRQDQGEGARAPARLRAHRQRTWIHGAIALAGRRNQLRRPGRPARAQAPHALRSRGRVCGPAPGTGASGRIQAVRAGLLRHRLGRLGLGRAPLPVSRRTGPRPRRLRTPPARGQHRADRGACWPWSGAWRDPPQCPAIRR